MRDYLSFHNIIKMLSKALQSILRRYFGEFITGLQNVQLAFWTGKINIQNASFKHERINDLLKGHNIPLSIKFSFLGNLQIDVPWNKLTSAPVEIKISNVMIVLKLEKVIGSKVDVQNLKQHAKLTLIKNYLSYLLKKSEEIKAQQSTQSGFMQKLFAKILHNLNLEVNNIHIRIENNNNTIIQSDIGEDQFVDCKNELQVEDLGFSLGFCLESVEAQTINANNIKQFVRIQNDKTQIRKKINLKQINLYWEEHTSINLFQYPQDRKIDFLRKIISRKQHRLLTIDGQILMERGKENFDYFFSTSFRLLEIGLNYEQLKQFIEVYQQFINAKAKKKLTKMKEIDYSQQLNLQSQFKVLFKKLNDCNFTDVQKKDISLLESIDKKLLMKWTKQEVIQIIKKIKLKQAYDNKNKRTWIGFLSKNVQNQLSQEQISTIQKQINKFINMIEQESFNKSIGFYIHFNLLRLIMDHHKVQQQLLFSAENIQLQFQGSKGEKKASLEILDVSLIYSDLMKQSEVSIFKNYHFQNQQKFFSLRVDDSKNLQKVDVSIGEMKIIHQIQFLSFLAQLIKLRQRQKIKSQMVIISPQLKRNNQQRQNLIQKVYQCNILMRRLEVMIELSATSRLNAHIQSITVQKQREINCHSTKIANLGIIFLQSQGQENKNYNILDDLNIQISLRKKLQIVQSSIPVFRITLNQQSLYYIVHCMRNQYQILKIRSVQNSNQIIGEQKLMQGETSIMSVFKAVNIYHSILTSQYLYFYQKDKTKIRYDNLVKKLLLRNIQISKIDSHSFKLQSVLVNEIITCKDEQDTDRWIYHIQQRIFENSTKMQIFSMMQENDGQAPAIYIPYDSLIQMQVNRLQVIYQKNYLDKIMSVGLTKLKISLKQNNLQFQRKVDLDQVRIVNLTLRQQKRQEYNLILSNTYNYFQDLDEDEEPQSNIEILIEGKKKTHPKYTGQLTIKSRINKLFVNYNAEFAYSILYRLLVGEVKTAYYSEQAKYLKIIQMMKTLLQTKNDIDQRYAQAKSFQFNKSYVELQKYKEIYSCLVLFHVQIKLQELQVNMVNGRTFHWLSKLTADSISFQIDKSADFMFIKGSATTLHIFDITGYPNTSQLPFTQMHPYPIIQPHKNRKSKQMLELSVGVYEPMTFINSQRFKNYFLMNLNDGAINYQQQPLLRFVDFLTNQVILFILQPFYLHKYDSPNRGPFQFASMNFTQEQVRKMLYQSMYPTFTHLNINGSNLLMNFNSHPNDELIPFSIDKVTLKSVPSMNPQKIHVRLDEFKRFKQKYRLLQQIAEGELRFDQKIAKCQWITRYLITAQGFRSQIMDNVFDYEMYFQRTNNGEKDLLLPFLMIEKDLLMQGFIKQMILKAPRNIYNLINKCFLFNLSYDDKSDGLYNTNYQFQHLNIPNKLIYRLLIDQLQIIIPQISKTVIIIQNCQYKFLKLEDTTKQMQVNGKSLYIVNSQQSLITPVIDQSKERGLQYTIIMKPSGEKKMISYIRHIDLHYYHEPIMVLFKYFLLDQSCYPKQDVYTDIPLIISETYLENSYIKLVQNDQHVYALKGDIKVVWSRYQQPHPENYKQNLQLYPKDKDGSSYDIQFRGVTFRKYNKQAYSDLSSTKQAVNYRSLSSSMRFNVTLTNVMKLHNDIKYSDMVGFYQINSLVLKLSYQDYQEITSHFKKDQPKEPLPPPPALPYTPYSKHKVSIGKCSLQFGLSELPVPLIDLNLQNSQIDVQLIGKTNVMTTKIQFNINYWNMMIGRWQPLIQRSSIQLTLKAGQFEKYLMATSSKALLLNFSVQSLKVLKLISKDISQKGNMHIINKDQRIKGVQISPYIITNRTGYSIIIHSDFIITEKLKNNQKMHLQNRNLQLQQAFSTVQYQIQGDGSYYDLNLNLNEIQKPTINYNQHKYKLVVSTFATPVLKQIIISSPYVIHNTTKYPLVMTVGQKQYSADAGAKISIPFTEQIHDNKTIRIQFLHLNEVSQNFNFQFRDIVRGYEHYIIYQDCRTFNCLISLQSQNQNVITISPLITFINLLPLDVVMQIALTKLNKDKIILHRQLEVNQQQLFYQFGSKDDASLRIHIKGFNFSEFTNINLTNQKDSKEINNIIKFVDFRGIQSFVRNKIIKKQKRKYVYLYTDSVLINQTDYKFYIYNEYELLAGQRLKGISQSDSKYIFLNNIQSPSICFSQDDPSQSKKIKSKKLGDQILLLNNHNQLHEMVINNSVDCIREQVQIFTSITRVSPRFILVNKCRRELAFQQFNTDQQFRLNVGERKDWFWYHNEEACLITVTAIDSQFDLPNGWGYSAPFSLQKIEETVLVIRPKDKSPDRLLMKTQIIKQNQQIFIIFKQLIEKQDTLIKIQNNLKLVNLQVHQEYLDNVNPPWIQYKHFICGSLKQVDFGWDYPQQEHNILVSFQFIGPYRSRFNNDTITLNLQKMEKPQFIDFKAQNDDQVLTIQVSVEIVGLRRTLIFQNRDESQASNYNEQELLAQMYGNKMGISLSQIGISIIGGKTHRSQMLYMSIKKLDLIMTEKQMKRNYQLKIKYINIDNNLNHNTMYPVLFTPLQYRKTFTKSRPFFICLIEQNLKTKQIMEINYFRMCIEPISFKIYDQMLTRLYDFQQSFNAEQRQKTDIDLNILFQCKQTQYEWQRCSIAKEGSSIFIRQIQIGKVIVQISFSLRPTSSGNIIIYTIFALFKTALSNISESQMKLNRFLCNNLSLGDVMRQLGQFYKNQVFKQIYKIAGSINLLGNPYVFFRYLAEGAWEIVNQPSQGFIKGPIEGAVGIGRGGVYFVRNVVAGTFNSVEVISQSCSRGLAYITFDDKFITRREKIQMQKSRHLIQGSKSALWALYTGFQVAITGIVRHPTEEKKKIGTAGIFKGLAIGIAGLVTKPMSGLFQALSKFSQGIKQTALFFQDGPNSTRSRPPRVFLSHQEYYTDYNVQESKAINLLQFHSTKHLEKTILLVAVDDHVDDCIYTVVTSEYLVQLSKKNKKIIKEVKLVDINQVQLEEVRNKRGVRIKYNNQQLIIVTQKYRQLYECFKEIFTKEEEQIEEYDQQN